MSRKPKPLTAGDGSSQTSNGAREKDPAGLESRALGIVVGYLMGRFTKDAVEMGRPLGPELADNSIRDKIRWLREGVLNIDKEGNADDFRGHIAATLAAHEDDPLVQEELSLMWSLFMKAGIEFSPSKIILNYDSIDKEFIRSLNLSINSQGRALRRELHGKFGGIWYIIRRSTEDKSVDSNPIYNISQLNVKPNDYWKRREGEWQQVNSHLLRFSIRARADDDENARQKLQLQAYKGRLLEFDNMTYFIGNREPSPRMVMMAVPTPQGQVHPTEISGVITVVNSGGTTISAPIGCVFDGSTLREGIKRREYEKNQAYGRRVSEIFETKAMEGLARVVTGSRKQVVEILEPVASPDVVQRVLDQLEATIAGAGDGYFKVSA